MNELVTVDSDSDESDLNIDSEEEYEPPPHPTTPSYSVGNKTSEIGTAASYKSKAFL